MSLPIAIGMIIQTFYYLVDLYFVGALGDVALAGVSSAGNIAFLVIGLTQILNVGTVSLISQAVGRKDKQEANLIFNQSLMISTILGLLMLVLGIAIADSYLSFVAADEATIESGRSYFIWFLPNLALQFALVAMGASLRGTGIVKPTMVVQMVSILINILLAPILISGWLTGYAMGVAGAGLASSIAAVVAVILLWVYFHRLEHYVAFDYKLFIPQSRKWRKIIAVGFPSGGEFLLMFIYMAVIYWVIKDFGVDSQAGFGLGSRIMQAIFVPALAIAFALPAIVGQNFGAQNPDRVRDAFKQAVIMVSLIMAIINALAIWQPEILFHPFTNDPEVLKVAVIFISIISFNFVPSGIIFTCSGLFQGLGNAWPSLISTSTRLLSFAIPAIWLSHQPNFTLEKLWYLSMGTVIFQSLFSLFLARREMNKRLTVSLN